MKIDPDAVLWSAPERERAGRPLLVLLHGYASHEGDLFGLSPQLPLEPVIASVRAPIEENGGYAWFSRGTTMLAEPTAESIDEASLALLAWLDTLGYTSVSLLGFSQGAVIALQLLRLAPARFRCAVALSGFVAPSDHPGDAELARVKPPVFWGRGTLDQVIPTIAIERTSTWIPAHSTPTIRIYEDLGHAVSPQELKDLNAFLRTNA